MSLFDRLFAIAPVRRAILRIWYPYLTSKLRNEDVLFLNYAFEANPPTNLGLEAEDESNRSSIQLYHHVASQVALKGKDVLEVSCGHGGGASWLARTMQPAHYTGIDLNPRGIRFCQQRHAVDGLDFKRGDAQKLPFPDRSLDAVINVEASHCYPDFSGFLAEVTRVLRPGGHFLYADFRFAGEVAAWKEAMANAAGFETVQSRDIGAEVLRGMRLNAERSRKLVADCLPRKLHSLGLEFAGVPGTRLYDALEAGDVSYRSWCLRRME